MRDTEQNARERDREREKRKREGEKREGPTYLERESATKAQLLSQRERMKKGGKAVCVCMCVCVCVSDCERESERGKERERERESGNRKEQSLHCLHFSHTQAHRHTHRHILLKNAATARIVRHAWRSAACRSTGRRLEAFPALRRRSSAGEEGPCQRGLNRDVPSSAAGTGRFAFGTARWFCITPASNNVYSALLWYVRL